MSKKLILCFDGTCNDPEDAVQGSRWFGLGGPEDASISNVLKLHLMFGGDLKRPVNTSDQMSFYYKGVGTYGDWWQRLKNAYAAPEMEDVGSIIKRGFQDLYEHYQDGDEIFLFGFSRGAAIARRFAAVMQETFEALDPTRKPRVRFIGVFDTVAAMNKPNLRNAEVKPASDVIFEDNHISTSIDEALHLVSLDEKRIAFYPTLMNHEDRVTEIWFPGAHSDIGGGYRYDGLSDNALQFMLDEIRHRDLGLQIIHPQTIDYDALSDDVDIDIEHQDVIVQSNPMGKSHQQHAITHIKNSFLSDRKLRKIINDKHSSIPAILHHSVVDRIHHDDDYRPLPLKKANMKHPYTGALVEHTVLYPDRSTENFESLSEHIWAGPRPAKRLEVGETVTFPVYANQKFNPSGVLMVADENYEFSVPLNQKWFDATIECDPRGWDRNNEEFLKSIRWLIGRMEDDRRHPDAMWFELIGTVNKTDDGNFRVLEHTAGETPYRPAVKGEFFAYANDLDSKYGNNLGSIDVTIKRVG